ncbi:RagB/SusD family nutrient uptake outer membrane protein [Chitinophaga sp. Ak27]|nr:RagB/SusD family nutrient uptake outer membrane protein [Chitinophaga sp. Ak27]
MIILGVSCKKSLELSPEDSFGSNSFWQNEAQVGGFMQGMHTQFRANQFQFLRLGEFRGGSLSTTEIFPVSLNEVPLIEQNLEEISAGVGNWAGFYTNILQLNLFIKKTEAASFLTGAQRGYFLGQAYAMRAYYYFQLLRTYGGVPLRLEPEVIDGTTDQVALRKARATEGEVLAAIKSDINQAITKFGASATANKGQWNPMAALMLKGEIYLWSAKVYNNNADLAIAKTALNAITGFSLCPNFADVFSYTKKKNSEIILAMSFQSTEAEMSGVNLFTYDLAGLGGGFYPDSLASGAVISTNPDPLNIGQPNALPAIQRYRYKFELFQSYDNADTRKLATFYDFYKVNKSGVPPYPVIQRNTVLKKFLGIFEQNKRYFSDDWPVYREADRLLMLAEIINAEGGDPTVYIKQIRDRAFGLANDPTPFVNGSKDANELAIFSERSKEFVYEGKRWYDLRRMKYGTEPLAFISPNHPYGVLNKTTQAYRMLWPIEPAIWTNDPLVDQTPGYSTSKPH